MMRRWLALLAALGALAGPARADDIAATARGVVRVVTIAVVDGEVVGFGHGSGVAVAPNRIVTNAHVVELANRYPDDVVIGVVPSEGAKSYRGRVVAYDPDHDLALIEFRSATLPPAAIFTGPVGEGEGLVALGYPGNVDLATARSAADYISPVAPVRSEGVFSGRRRLTGTDVLLHTAPIARGNSGGPLLDRCGRVVGINSAITRNEEGDSGFGFAIAASELLAFLRDAKQPAVTTGLPCTSMEERLREDAAADAHDAAEAAATRREAAASAGWRREEALLAARDAAAQEREDVMALAALLLVLGALGVGAAGYLDLKSRREARWWALGIGALGMAAGGLVFAARPRSPALPTAPDRIVAGQVAATGKLLCALDPDRSRVTVSQPADLTLDYQPKGCAGDRPWVETNGRAEQVLLGEDGAVTRRRYDPATRRLDDTRWLLGARDAAALAKLMPAGLCADGGRGAGEAYAAVARALPALPNEKLSYRCAPASSSSPRP